MPSWNTTDEPPGVASLLSIEGVGWSLMVWCGVGQGKLVLDLGLGENYVDVGGEARW